MNKVHLCSVKKTSYVIVLHPLAHALTPTPFSPPRRSRLSAGFILVSVCSRWFNSALWNVTVETGDGAPPPHTHTLSVMHFYSCGFSLSCFAECALYHTLSSFPSHPPLIFSPFSIFSPTFPRSFLYCSPDVFLFSSSSYLLSSLYSNICKIISILLAPRGCNKWMFANIYI